MRGVLLVRQTTVYRTLDSPDTHQERLRDLDRRRRGNRPDGTVLQPGTMEVTPVTDRPGLKVIGYVRVSTAEQATTGAGMMAQEATIRSECERRDWEIIDVIHDGGASGKDLKRPGISRALEMLFAGEADALVVAKLDRLSRSMLDFAGIMTTAQKQGWAVVALDCSVDTTTPAGEAMANVMATFAQFERRLIGQRTREALEAKRTAGVRLGRPSSIAAPLARRISRERAEGRSLREIAAALNADGIPTPRGGATWRPSSLESALRASCDASVEHTSCASAHSVRAGAHDKEKPPAKRGRLRVER